MTYYYIFFDAVVGLVAMLIAVTVFLPMVN
jgi:hypothetical protein